jgi:hypothetical protein
MPLIFLAIAGLPLTPMLAEGYPLPKPIETGQWHECGMIYVLGLHNKCHDIHAATTDSTHRFSVSLGEATFVNGIHQESYRLTFVTDRKPFDEPPLYGMPKQLGPRSFKLSALEIVHSNRQVAIRKPATGRCKVLAPGDYILSTPSTLYFISCDATIDEALDFWFVATSSRPLLPKLTSWLLMQSSKPAR